MMPSSGIGHERLVLAPPLVLVFLLPFAHTTALRSLMLLLTLAAAIYVWRKDPGPSIPLKLPLALWAGMALISLAWARDPAYSLSEIQSAIGLNIVYFVAFFALTRDARQWTALRGALLAGVITMTYVATWVYARTGDLNVDSALGGALSASTYLVTVFPLLLVAAFEFRTRKSVLAVAVLAVIAALLVGYMTFNRMFIVAIVASSVTVVATITWRRHVNLPSLRVLALAAAIFASASAAFFLSVAQDRVGTEGIYKTVRTTVAADPRWDIWKFSVELIRQRPLSGVGLGLFAAKDLYRAEFPEERDRFNTHAHNPFLNSAVQMGIGGVVALLILLCSLLRQFWLLWRSDRTQVSLIGTAGLAMLIGVLVKAQADDIWGRHNGYLFWALTGAMLGYGSRLNRDEVPGVGASSGNP